MHDEMHTLPHSKKIFWSIDNHISFSSNQQIKHNKVYLVFHRKKGMHTPSFTAIFHYKHYFIPIKRTNNCYDTSHNCMKIKPWLHKHFTIKTKANKLDREEKSQIAEYQLPETLTKKVAWWDSWPRHKPLDLSLARLPISPDALLVQRYK